MVYLQRYADYILIQVRKRDPDFPEVVRVYREEHEQPSPVVHCDWSSVGSLDVLRWCFPGNENFWEGKRFDMLKYVIPDPTLS